MNESEEPPITPPQSKEEELQLLKETQIDAIYNIVASEFKILDNFMERGILTFHVQLDSNSKEAFLRLVKKLEPMGLTPLLRKTADKNILRIIRKPPTKKSNILINWILFLATLATTFFTGYMISIGREDLDPVFGGLTFMVTIMAILGIHEMGHKIAANKHGVEATAPYFIPSPPQLGIGTFGAVIMQKSLPPNRDALFDVGAAGPLAGFLVSLLASILGLQWSQIHFSTELLPGLPPPIIFELIAPFLITVPPHDPSQYVYILLHPVAYAGWIGMIVTMLNLLPVGTLDGGHIAESLFRGKARTLFLIISVFLLILTPFWLMLFFVLFFAMYRHPGPLDGVSSLSMKRKLTAIAVLFVFVLTMPMPSIFY